MAKIQNWVYIFIVLCWHSCASGQPVLTNGQPVLTKVEKQRKEIVELALSQVGVRELTGNNDGPEVEGYLIVTGLKKGFAWCSAFLAWLHDKLGIPNPMSAWSPDWFKSNVVFSKFDSLNVGFRARIGQVGGLFFPSKGRIAHTVIITNVFSESHYETVEGNTTLRSRINMAFLSDEEKEQERSSIWVANKIRNKRDIAMISDFVGRKEILAGWKKEGSKIKIKI